MSTPEVAPTPPTGDDPRTAFERRLAREILLAERFRATLLAMVPAVAMLAFLGVSSAYPDALAEALHGRFDRTPVGLFLCAVSGFEFHVLYATERMLRASTRPSALRRYAYVFIETSLPTLVVLYYGSIVGPARALLMPSTFVYFVFIVLSTLRLDFFVCAFAGLVACVEYAGMALLWAAGDPSLGDATLTSLPQHLARASLLAVAGVASGFVASRIRASFTRAIESLEERGRILGVLGQHVSPEVAETLVAREGGRGASRHRHVCIMFLDVRGFTAFAEKRAPDEVVAYLDTLFEEAVEAVAAHHGIVNKFLGDGFMAVFGGHDAPDAGPPASDAVAAGLEVIRRVEALVASGRIPTTRVGLGLHAGTAVVGNVGSSRRREYTVIGDVVNVASRVESLNRDWGTQMLVTEEVWRVAATAGVQAIRREPLQVRGRETAVSIFQLV